MNKEIKAIIFDLGGVCLASPLNAIERYEIENNLPKNYINIIIASWGSNGPFQKLERGEVQYPEFYKEFHERLNQKENVEIYTKFLKSKNLGLPIQISNFNFEIDGKKLFLRMMNEATKPIDTTFKAINHLKALGCYKLIALTNSVEPWDTRDDMYQPLGKLFDKIICSHKIGLRKPDVKIFNYTLNAINLKPEECIFLDDIGTNLKPANKMGIKTILFKSNKPFESIKELGNLLNIDLLDNKKNKL